MDTLPADLLPVLPVIAARRTGAPYPLLALLERSALLRRDLRGTHAGIVLDLHLHLVDAQDHAPIAAAAIYLQQDSPTPLRGVQLSDADGRAHLRTLRPHAGAEGRAAIELQICPTAAGQVCAIANLKLLLPGWRRGDDAPAQPVLESPGVLLLPAPLGEPATGQSVALAIALACNDEPSPTPTEDHHATP